MPSWRLHWLIADILGYGRDELVERLIDAGPLHDIGISVVKEPYPPYMTEGGARRHKLARNAKQVLQKLASKPHLFYLHHALDDLFERVKSSRLLGIELDPDTVLRGIRIDLHDIRLRILGSMRISFPLPPSNLFENLHKHFKEITNVLSDEAMEKLNKRLEFERRINWSEFVHQVIERMTPRAKKYFNGVSRIYHVEKAISMTETYLLNTTRFYVAVEASKRSRFYDYVAVYGGSLRKFYTNISTLVTEALAQVIMELGLQQEQELMKSLENSWRRMEELIEEAEKLINNAIKNIIINNA